MADHSTVSEVPSAPVVDEKHALEKKGADSINIQPELDIEIAEKDEKVIIQPERTYGIDAAYVEKSQLIADAMQGIGMTAWQYQFWALCGFAWIVDNVRNAEF